MKTPSSIYRLRELVLSIDEGILVFYTEFGFTCEGYTSLKPRIVLTTT
jgi:hypothetical protein